MFLYIVTLKSLVLKSLAQTAGEAVQKLFTWNDDQVRALEAGKTFCGSCCLIEGPPGTVKTRVLAGLAIFYMLCGFYVLMTPL